MELMCPLYLEMGVKEKKKYYLNLNSYRNRHFIVSNNLKKLFKEFMQPQISKLKPIEGTIGLRFTYYARSKLVGDLENHCICVDKFLQDALVENGIISEDNCNVVNEVHYIYGGISKENPGVVCEILNILDN